MAFDKAGLDSYVDVAERIAEFRSAHPDGSLQPADLMRPFWLEEIGGQVFVCYAAAAYRSEEDIRPGIGCAWEKFPGTTPYTRGSELMNAETSAWGRAIIAALAADSRRGVASREEVRNRQAERDEPAPAVEERPGGRTLDQSKAIHAAFSLLGIATREERMRITSEVAGRSVPSSSDLSYREAQALLGHLHRRAASPKDAS